MPYPTITHTITHHGLLLTEQNIQLTRDGLGTNMAKRAGIARASMRTLPMVSSVKVLGTGVAWICTVSYPHTHRHARCTLLTHFKIHLMSGCLSTHMPKRAGTARAGVCPLPMVSSVKVPDAGVTWICTPYLPTHAPSCCIKRTTKKLNKSI